MTLLPTAPDLLQTALLLANHSHLLSQATASHSLICTILSTTVAALHQLPYTALPSSSCHPCWVCHRLPPFLLAADTVKVAGHLSQKWVRIPISSSCKALQTVGLARCRAYPSFQGLAQLSSHGLYKRLGLDFSPDLSPAASSRRMSSCKTFCKNARLFCPPPQGLLCTESNDHLFLT